MRQLSFGTGVDFFHYRTYDDEYTPCFSRNRIHHDTYYYRYKFFMNSYYESYRKLAKQVLFITSSSC